MGLLGLNLYEVAIYDIKKFGQGDLKLLSLQTDNMIFFSWLMFNKIYLGVMIDIEGNLGILKQQLKDGCYILSNGITLFALFFSSFCDIN